MRHVLREKRPLVLVSFYIAPRTLRALDRLCGRRRRSIAMRAAIADWIARAERASPPA